MREHPTAWAYIRKDGSISVRLAMLEPYADVDSIQVRIVPLDDYDKRSAALQKCLDSALCYGGPPDPIVAQLREALAIEQP